MNVQIQLLQVQAAWDQGITGKNVTTAIMDDGELNKHKIHCEKGHSLETILIKSKLTSKTR